MEQGIEIQRFKKIREHLNLTQTAFAELLGVKNSTADIERGKSKISGKIVVELMKQFKINPLWLYGESNQQFLDLDSKDCTPKVISLNSEAHENILMVNQKAAAGYPQNILDREWYHQLPAFDMPLPQFRNATYRGFQIEGDSMLPTLFPGDWVLAKALGNISEIQNNSMYVFVLQDAVVVKKVEKLPELNALKLISINDEYDPYTVSLYEIQEVWQVNSRLTFSLEEDSNLSILRQLKASMNDLKKQLKK
ncbi:helix-turn-helix transcriptional regulator [Zhouia sp. PK063]|uniref:helix-turn-helix transcriptional regulator n=1 Tax=Zhouia sp. PK063 TaxID=3373602 RepID=UPI0037B620A9